jgi:hypothetical protein
MAKKPAKPNIIPRQIVGFSLSPELASEVKMEAARRGISLKKLFAEVWERYKKETKTNK